MKKEIVTYHIQVKGYRWFDRFTVPYAESDEAFLNAYPRLLAELKEALKPANPDCETLKYRAIKRTSTITDEVLA